MSFYDTINKYKEFDVKKHFTSISDDAIFKSLNKDELNIYDFLNLISPLAQKYIEEIAQKAHHLTIQYFGRTITLYTPIYVSNYCINTCTYCGFSKGSQIKRRQLTLKEIDAEAQIIQKSDMKHILLLTGEAPQKANMEYIKSVVKILKKYFSSISIEIHPLETEDYKELKLLGVDGLTVYQELYDEKNYSKYHLSGPKQNYKFRLLTPERGAIAGIRSINIGTLFGLGEPFSEAFYAALHAEYLTNKYLDTEFGISLPRIKKIENSFNSPYELDDKTFVQFILAYRLFLPKIGINLSTRENAKLRDNLIGLGVTKYSAGSKTNVGGYSEESHTDKQFELSDNRTVEEIVRKIKSMNYQVIYKDWELIEE